MTSTTPKPTLIPATPAPADRPASYIFLAVPSLVIAALDLGTKYWATRKLGGAGGPGLIRVIEHLNFTLAHNKGGAGSFLSTTPDAFRLPFFLGVSTVAIGAMVVFYRKLLP
ncbi:MAG: signal peptidase II, partial [Myxococcales bacterium]|nr:signal peptidase II [Polyangiaceae bacterium]MDW8251498.1 signal peptidase II [Myxococcales bacterium]